MPAMIRPAVRSLLIRSLAAGGGAVHGDVTLATCGERRSWSTMSVPTAAGLRAVEAGCRRDGEQQLDPALAELVGQQLGALRRFRCRILESARRQAFRDGHAKDGERKRQQRRDGDDPPRRGDGQPCDPLQQVGPSFVGPSAWPANGTPYVDLRDDDCHVVRVHGAAGLVRLSRTSRPKPGITSSRRRESMRRWKYDGGYRDSAVVRCDWLEVPTAARRQRFGDHGRSTARRIHSARRRTHAPGSGANVNGVDSYMYVFDRFWFHDL